MKSQHPWRFEIIVASMLLLCACAFGVMSSFRYGWDVLSLKTVSISFFALLGPLCALFLWPGGAVINVWLPWLLVTALALGLLAAGHFVKTAWAKVFTLSGAALWFASGLCCILMYSA